MKSNYYIVRLLIRMGEYEKHTLQAVSATSEDDAIVFVLCEHFRNRTADWWDDDRSCEVDMCKKISNQDYRDFRRITGW